MSEKKRCGTCRHSIFLMWEDGSCTRLCAKDGKYIDGEDSCVEWEKDDERSKQWADTKKCQRKQER